MYLYLLEQDVNIGWDTYDSCVVCAESPEDAKTISPDGNEFPNDYGFNTWAYSIDSIKCTELGKANKDQKRGLIIASFNAG